MTLPSYFKVPLLYEGKHLIGGNEITLTITRRESESAESRLSGGFRYNSVFLDFLTPELSDLLTKTLPGYSRYFKQKNFDKFLKDTTIDFLREKIIKVLNEFSREVYAAHIQEIIVLLVLPHDNSRFTPLNLPDQKQDRARWVITLQTDYLVRDCLASPERNHNIMTSDRMLIKTLPVRVPQGVINATCEEIFRHEFSHALHYLITGSRTFELEDPNGLYKESISRLVDFREKQYLIYPQSTTFTKLASKSITTRHDDLHTSLLHDIGFFMAYFIGLADLKEHQPNIFATLTVVNAQKERTAIKWIKFAELLKDENRPIYFQNLPQDVTTQTISNLQKMTPRQFHAAYIHAAKILGIPKKHLLARKKPFRKLEEGNLVFSS